MAHKDMEDEMVEIERENICTIQTVYDCVVHGKKPKSLKTDASFQKQQAVSQKRFEEQQGLKDLARCLEELSESFMKLRKEQDQLARRSDELYAVLPRARPQPVVAAR